MTVIDEIFDHAGQEAPRECCGLGISNGKNQKYIPMKNLHEDNNNFEMDGQSFLYYQLNSNIKYIVHSHYEGDCRPSEHDINSCNEVGIPYLIVSYPNKDYHILEPTYE